MLIEFLSPFFSISSVWFEYKYIFITARINKSEHYVVVCVFKQGCWLKSIVILIKVIQRLFFIFYWVQMVFYVCSNFPFPIINIMQCMIRWLTMILLFFVFFVCFGLNRHQLWVKGWEMFLTMILLSLVFLCFNWFK